VAVAVVAAAVMATVMSAEVVGPVGVRAGKGLLFIPLPRHSSGRQKI
jgi:hypothetical protein